jgi:hypothetical protein
MTNTCFCLYWRLAHTLRLHLAVPDSHAGDILAIEPQTNRRFPLENVTLAAFWKL